mmetsp:Transcript_47114/g.117498  ORF Transcript_47114/g.117498 Transcript_47114/m.117498 type:complete len:347 (-) Transcript_47114:13-1053(-)
MPARYRNVPQDKPDPLEPKMDHSHLLLSSVTSGVLVSVICTPFDVVKNYTQGSTNLVNRLNVKPYRVLQDVYKNRGLLGFWTGLTPTLAVILPANLIFFGLYERWKKNWGPAIAGVQARSTVVFVVAPFEYMRTRRQVEMGMGKTGFGLVKEAVQTEGLYSMWRGVFPTLVRDVPFSAIYWDLYERGKGLIRLLDDRVEERHPVVRGFLYPFVNGGLSALVASAVTHPFDVVKTRLQVIGRHSTMRGNKIRISKGTVNMMKDIYKEGGYRAFWVGVVPRCLKIMPSCAVLLGTYELTKHLFTDETRQPTPSMPSPSPVKVIKPSQYAIHTVGLREKIDSPAAQISR